MVGFRRIAVLAALAPALFSASNAQASDEHQRGVTMMTQNLYQGTEFANTLAARTLPQFLAGVAADYNNGY